MLQPLSPEQWEALATDRHLAVVANAGSGKTRVLTYRFLWLLIEHSVDIERIVAITFTTKAAAEMRERVRKLIQSMLDDRALRDAMQFSSADDKVVKRLKHVRRQLGESRISTFHSFCATLLRQFGHVVQIDPESVELSERDSTSMRERALRRAMHRYMDERQHEILDVYESLDFTAFERAVGSLARSAERFHILEKRHSASEPIDEQCDRAVRTALLLLGRSVSRLLQNVIADVDAVGEPTDEGTLKTRSSLAEILARLQNDDQIGRPVFADAYSVLIGPYTKDGTARKRGVFPGSTDLSPIDKKMLTMIGILGAEDTSEQDFAQATVAWHAARVAELAHEAYTQDKRERNAIDFDDMMSGVVNLLERHPEIASYVSTTISHLMVDEYQDTNPTQYRLMQLLVPQLRDPMLPPGPRVFVVGDDKQGIYGFRDADVRLFRRTVEDLQRINDREGASADTLLQLATSYRMAKPLADATNRLCEAFFAEESEFDVPYTPLVCGRSAEHDAEVGTLQTLVTDMTVPTPGLEDFSRNERESMTVVQQIVTMLSDGRVRVYDADLRTTRPVGPGDIAVLARRVASVTRIASYLHAANVPFQVHGGRAFFSRPEVADIRNLLTAAVDRENALALAAVLRSPIFRLTDADLARVAFGTDTRGFSWTALCTVAALPSASPELRTAVRTLEDVHERLRHEPPTDVLRDALSSTDWFGTIFEHPRSAQIMANVEKTFDIIRAASENPGATLRDVLDAIALPPDDDREAESAYDPDPNAVNVMTIHAAKGLEFPVVILCDLAGSLNWSTYTLTDTLGLTVHMGSYTMRVDADTPTKIPKGLIAQANSVIEQEREMAEARRLLYVALTRGQDHVYVSLVERRNAPNATTGEMRLQAPDSPMTELLQELLLGDERVLPQVTAPITDARYEPVRGPFQYHDRTESIDWDPAPTALSATELLTADAEYAAEGGSLAATTIGTIVHDTLEVILRSGIEVTLDEVIQQAQLHPMATGDLQGPVHGHLERLRSAPIWSTLEGVTTERTIGAMLDETLVYGRVDALRISGSTAELWDWKTNAVDHASLASLAEHYAIQMQAYAWILLSTQPLTSVTTRLVFTHLIGEDPKGAVVEQAFTPDDVEGLRAILIERRRTVVSA